MSWKKALACTVAALLAASCGSKDPDNRLTSSDAPALATARSSAEDAERRGDWPAAAGFRETELQAAPGDRSVELALVKALRRSNACGRAAPHLNKLQIEAPRDAAVLLEAGKCHLISGRFDAARTSFEAAVKADPKSWEAESMLGTAFDYLDHSAEALSHHNRAVVLAPGNAVALSNKSLSLALGGQLNEALVLMRQAASQSGAPVRVRANLALLEAIAGNGDVAAMMARQESASDPESIRLLQRLAAAARK